MKKILAIATLTALTMGVASATEIGVIAGRNMLANTDEVGVTVDQKFGKIGIEGTAEHSSKDVNQYSILGTYDLWPFKNAVLTAKAGGMFVDPAIGTNGYALVGGLGVSYPLTKSLSLEADYQYQAGQLRVKQYNGGGLSAGIKFAF